MYCIGRDAGILRILNGAHLQRNKKEKRKNK